METLSKGSPKKVLITGASGFTGRYVSQAMVSRGHEVIPLLDRSGAGINLLDADRVLEFARTSDADVVIHLAAIAFVAHGDVEEIYKTNILGTRNLLAGFSAAEKRPSQVILASSANVYGNVEGCLAETTPASPANDYAVSKYAMELMSKQFSDRLPIILTRPFNYTGVHQSKNFLIPKIVHHFRTRSELLELGNIHVEREFNDVRGIAQAYAILAEQTGVSDTYNLCTGNGHKLLDVLDLMEKLAGFRPRISINEKFVRANEVKRLVGDPSKIERVTTSIREYGLRESLKWMYEMMDESA